MQESHEDINFTTVLNNGIHSDFPLVICLILLKFNITLPLFMLQLCLLLFFSVFLFISEEIVAVYFAL